MKCYYIHKAALAEMNRPGMTEGDNRMVRENHRCKTPPAFVCTLGWVYWDHAKVWTCQAHTDEALSAAKDRLIESFLKRSNERDSRFPREPRIIAYVAQLPLNISPVGKESDD